MGSFMQYERKILRKTKGVKSVFREILRTYLMNEPYSCHYVFLIVALFKLDKNWF